MARLQHETPPKGPEDTIRDRLVGQFWMRLVVLSTDLPEGPRNWGYEPKT